MSEPKMTVKQLIEKLQQFDENKFVTATTYDSTFYVSTVEEQKDGTIDIS